MRLLCELVINKRKTGEPCDTWRYAVWCLTPCCGDGGGQGLMLHDAAEDIVCLRPQRDGGQLTEGPVRLRVGAAESHALRHSHTVPGPCDVDGGGVEVADVTVEDSLLPQLCLLPGIDEHCRGLETEGHIRTPPELWDFPLISVC